MIKDEKVEWEGYEFEFVEIVKTEDELEVGDGYLGTKINVYDDGELIDTVEPGVLRFDTRSRSEVDRTIMWHGDLVFIMDGTQARELMEGSDLVRIMVYDLPGIHLVWGGWTLMLLASLAIWIPKNTHLIEIGMVGLKYPRRELKVINHGRRNYCPCRVRSLQCRIRRLD